MTKKGPFFSVVVPTRNRPEFVRYCLESLRLQTFGDFEVIVSDNHTGKPCKAVFDRFADGKFRYVTPPSPLAMHDNWEYACTFAEGQYVTVLIDKTILRPMALQLVNATLKRMHAELASWWNENYYLMDETRGYDEGEYVPYYRPQVPCYIDSREELKRRFTMDVRRGNEGIHYYWGKICFGVYHRDLIERIRTGAGRLFHPLSPDYTSMLAALAYARSVVDIGQPLTLSFVTRVSNGRSTEESDDYALGFIRGIDPTLRILNDLPLRGIFTSTHNVVAFDYLLMKKKVGEPMKDLILNRKNLILRAREDLDRRGAWDDESRRGEHYALWRRYCSELSGQDRLSIYLQLARSRLCKARQTLHRSLKQIGAVLPGARTITAPYLRWRWARQEEACKKLGLACNKGTRRHSNVLEAARFADQYYESTANPLPEEMRGSS